MTSDRLFESATFGDLPGWKSASERAMVAYPKISWLAFESAAKTIFALDVTVSLSVKAWPMFAEALANEARAMDVVALVALAQPLEEFDRLDGWVESSTIFDAYPCAKTGEISPRAAGLLRQCRGSGPLS